MVAVDVSVLDKDGRPVRDLTADDFTIQVDGTARRLVTATFVPLGATARPSGVVSAPHYSTNAGAVGGRLVIFVVDRGNILRGEGRQLLEAASAFIDRLEPYDRVALAAIPEAGTTIDFTTDHRVVQRTIERAVGTATATFGKYTVGLTEALAIERQDQRTLDKVVGRECQVSAMMAQLPTRDEAGPGTRTAAESLVKSCEIEVRDEARSVYWTWRQQASASLASLRNLLERLALTSGPKTLVLLSEGLFVDTRERGEYESVARAAAAADVTFYALGLDVQRTDASMETISPTFNDDRVLKRQGLELLVGLTRGRFFGVATGATSSFDRITREISGYYLLSFEPEARDREGGIRQIQVDVRRPGVEVRARRNFLIDRGATAKPAREVLAETLRTPLLSTELVMRTATFVYPSDAGQLRVVIAADVEGATAAGAVPCGFSLTNDRGEVVGAEIEGPAAAAQPVPDGHAYLASFILDPGNYTLKLAAVDDVGRRGSVEHAFEAKLTAAGQLRLGDLMLADMPARPGREVRPSVDTRMTSEQVVGYVELTSEVPAVLDSAEVVLQVAPSASAPAIDTVSATIDAPTVKRRVAEGRVPTDLLPPGDYVARAVVTVQGREFGRVTRPFRVERPLESAATTEGAGPIIRPTVSTRMRGPAALAAIPAFSVERVVGPDVVGYFLDRLPRERPAPLGGPVAAAADAARQGRFTDVETALATVGDDDLTAMFLRGIARLARGDLEGAAREFRRTLRQSSEFFPAAFYLGACYAAGGRDDEAAGAWQTSLVSDESGAFVYELLGDAFLRLEDGVRAVDIAGEAQQLWPDEDRFVRQSAVAHAVARQHDASIAMLDRHLEKHPDDRDGWLLGLWVLYDATLSGRTVGGEPIDVRFGRYRERYASLNGPQLGLVDEWKRAMDKKR